MELIKRSAALALAAVLMAAGCAGEDGVDGTRGISGVPGKVSLTIDGVSTGPADLATLTFTIRPAATVCPGNVCDDTLSLLTQKTFYAAQYDAATSTVPQSFSFSDIHFKGITSDGNGARYTATRSGAAFAPETSTGAYVYGYIATEDVISPKGSYRFPAKVASSAKVYGTIPYTSVANVDGCERCHGAPYAKRGYRLATVAGLPDFASCKVCHYDTRTGGHTGWQLLAEDPAAYAAQGGTPTADQGAMYAYTANVMNDVHMAHAMEFAYPQTMANCVVCHEGKLGAVLNQDHFTIATCRSCHPVTTDPAYYQAGKRAPALADIMPTSGDPLNHMGIAIPDGLRAPNTPTCSGCHADGSGRGFADIHTGFNKLIYAADGTRYSEAITTTIGDVTFDDVTYVLTVPISMTGAVANAEFLVVVRVGLYGYDTKDFIAYVSASVTRDAVNLNEFVAVANLGAYAAMIGASIERAEIIVQPSLGLDPLAAPDNISTSPTYNPTVAISGATKTIRLAGAAGEADTYGKAIVDVDKCNACHDALGTTFHNPRHGSAGVVGCRHCHNVLSGGSHLEMQSRSIDSWIHAIHSPQPFDVDYIDFDDPVEKLRYEHQIESSYPNFAGPLNCESCHDAGTFDVPDQTLSLPGLLSGADPDPVGFDRRIGTVAEEITGPAARACGSCHRTQAINADDVSVLASLYAHTNMYGTNVTDTALVLDTAAYVQSLLGGPPFPGTPPPGAAVEQCVICHADAGSKHQALFNTWRDGLE